MRQIQWLSVIIILLFTACTSNEQKSSDRELPSNVTAQEDIKTKDTAYQRFIVDTTQTFDSMAKLTAYLKEVNMRNKQLKDGRIGASDFTIDSIESVNEDFSAYMLYRHLKSKDQKEENVHLLLRNFEFSNLVSLKDRLNLFNSFPESVKKSKSGQFVLQMLNEKISQNQSSIGVNISQLKPLQLVDSIGNKKSLTQWIGASGSYTLLIFSASWCLPCRREALELKNELQHLDTSRLKLITISIDNDKDKWMKAVKKDACPWQQLWVPGELDSDVAKEFKFTGIPANFLINERQQVIAQHINIKDILKKLPYTHIQ